MAQFAEENMTHAEWLIHVNAHRLDVLKQAKLAVRSAHRMRRKIEGAVNWADLDAVDAFIVLDENRHGDLQEWIEVLLSEASPDASELCNYVLGKLHAAGYADIIVTAEW